MPTHRPPRREAALTLLIAAACAPATPPPASGPATPGQQRGGESMMYTTYFYTAAEAIIHAYADETRVRVARIEGDKGTIWQGVLQRGQTQTVATGVGVFAFFSDKKAGLLVGTPTSCSAVGYFATDENGSYRSDHFFTALSSGGPRVFVWAWEPASIRVTDRQSQKLLHEGALGKNQFVEVTEARSLPSRVLEVTADRPVISVQVYEDEGYVVPATNGRMTGREFGLYVGTLTNGVNDLQLFGYGQGARAKVVDLQSQQVLWEGQVPGNGVHNLTLSDKFVFVTASQDISVSVAPFEHYKGGYYEHHYAAGREGTGIDREFLVTTPGELWIFSYYADNAVAVTNQADGKPAWNGTLGAGGVAALQPGWGLYRITSSKGTSVMAGFGTCGAAFSPAGGMFAVDEALFAVIREVKQQRVEQAVRDGRQLSRQEIEAPLSADEMKQVTRKVKKATADAAAAGPAAAPSAAPPASMSDAEIIERAQSIEQR